MRTYFRQLLPTPFEITCVASVSLALLIAGNAKVFLERYGLIDSSDIVRDQVTSTVSNGLRMLDSFKATPGLVTFITWGIIGLVLFSVAQAFVRASGAVQFERELGSNLYIHPANFNRSQYWKNIALNTALSFGLIVLLIIVSILYLLFIVPMGFEYVQRYLFDSTLLNSAYFALGIVTIFAGTLMVYTPFKAFVWQHRISRK